MPRTARLNAAGVIVHLKDNRLTYATQGRLFFGEAKNPVISQRVKDVQALFDRAGITYETPVDMLAGKVIELGKIYDIPTPVNKKIFRSIKGIERGNPL